MYQVQGDACLLLDSYPLTPNQIKVISIHASRQKLYVLHEGAHVLVYTVVEGMIVRNEDKYINLPGRAFKMMIEDEVGQNLVLFGHQTGFTIVSL